MAIIYNPATAEPVADTIEHEPAEVSAAVHRSGEVQNKWAGVSFRKRAAIIRRSGAVISRRCDEVADLISRLTGKTAMDALSAEVIPAVLAARYYARSAAKTLKPRRISGGSIFFFNKKSTLFREPLGVVGIISPWNYPFSIPIQEVFMALMAGNGVVLKVATQCQPLGDLIADILAEAGLPRGLLQVTHVSGRLAGSAFIQSGIAKLFFTGSVAVGKQLAEEAGRRLLPVSLELGGNDAMVVCEDANIERAVNGAMWAGFSNCGQSCGGVERVFIHNSRYEEFRTLLSKRVRAMRHTAGTDSHEREQGSLTTEKQRATVTSHIEDAISKGAAVVAQSGEPEGGFRGFSHPVTVLENVDMNMDVQQHETFGPLITLTRFSSDEEAIGLANEAYLGLTASVWSRRKSRAAKIAAGLQAGAITVNDHLMSHGLPETPWGGYKDSSLGRSHSALGFEEMTEAKVVIHDSLGNTPRQMWWYPHNSKVYTGLKSLLGLLHGPRRFRSAFRLIGTFMRMFRRPRE